MTMSRGPYRPVASCVYDGLYPNPNPNPNPYLLRPHEIEANHEIEEKRNNNDNLMMIGATGLYTGMCFTALAFGGTIIAPTILTVAGVAVVGVGAGIAGYIAVRFVKEKIQNLYPSPTPSSAKKINEGKNNDTSCWI